MLMSAMPQFYNYLNIDFSISVAFFVQNDISATFFKN